jgi:hypothetical protein
MLTTQRIDVPQMKSSSISILLIFGGVFFTALGVQADTVFVSYGDRTGYSRPNTIQQFDSVTLIDRGPFATSGMSLPEGLALDAGGNLYVANYGDNTITRFAPDGVGSVFGQTGSGPTSLAFDPVGNLYVANYWANTIEKFTPSGVRSVFADSHLVYPTGLAVDSTGNIFVANGGDLSIYKFTPSGQGSLFAVANWYNRPFGGIAIDAHDNLYLGCQATNTPGILKFTPSGAGSIFTSDGNLPTGLAFDSSGDLYAACYGSDTVVKYSPDGVRIDSIGTVKSPYGIAILAVPEPSAFALAFVGVLVTWYVHTRRRE